MGVDCSMYQSFSGTVSNKNILRYENYATISPPVQCSLSVLDPHLFSQDWMQGMLKRCKAGCLAQNKYLEISSSPLGKGRWGEKTMNKSVSFPWHYLTPRVGKSASRCDRKNNLPYNNYPTLLQQNLIKWRES